jgi:hypothetical protein
MLHHFKQIILKSTYKVLHFFISKRKFLEIYACENVHVSLGRVDEKIEMVSVFVENINRLFGRLEVNRIPFYGMVLMGNCREFTLEKGHFCFVREHNYGSLVEPGSVHEHFVIKPVLVLAKFFHFD